MKRDYKVAASDALLAIVNESIGEGPDAVLSLACALEDYARKMRVTRGEMLVSPVFCCTDCGKHWTVTMTVNRERDCTPENCPACFQKSGKSSGWASSFRYVESERAK